MEGSVCHVMQAPIKGIIQLPFMMYLLHGVLLAVLVVTVSVPRLLACNAVQVHFLLEVDNPHVFDVIIQLAQLSTVQGGQQSVMIVLLIWSYLCLARIAAVVALQICTYPTTCALDVDSVKLFVMQPVPKAYSLDVWDARITKLSIIVLPLGVALDVFLVWLERRVQSPIVFSAPKVPEVALETLYAAGV
jgi:hypothetical protein